MWLNPVLIVRPYLFHEHPILYVAIVADWRHVKIVASHLSDNFQRIVKIYIVLWNVTLGIDGKVMI